MTIAPVAVILLSTTDNPEDADRLAAALIEQRLAACVQIDGPIRSHYRWQGKIESANEWRLMVKTTVEMAAAAESALLQLHPYDEPEILLLPVTAGSPAYLSWLAAEVGPGDASSAEDR